MKVLYFTNLPVPYRMDFFNQLGKLCDLTVWVETEKRKKSNSAWLKRNKAETFKFEALKKFELSDSKYINYGYVRKLRKEKFDIVVVGTYYSVSAMLFIETLRALRINYILNSDGGFIRPDSKVKKLIKQHFIMGAAAYLSTGKLTDQYLEYYGAPRGRVFHYPFTSVYEKDVLSEVPSKDLKQKLRNKLGMKEQTIYVSVGSCIRRKGYDILLEVCKNFGSDKGFYLIGGKSTDDQLESLKQFVADNKLTNVYFIEFLDKDVLKEYYMAADAFVLPTREDVWGLVINEAAAYALPIITTDQCIAGTELVIDGKNGYLIPIENELDLMKAIESIGSCTNIRDEMSANILKTAKKYTIEKMAQSHLDVFNTVKNNAN